ncbi:hypothetical protein BH23ACT3_BH23ACT3_13880 [soil metagenome]
MPTSRIRHHATGRRRPIGLAPLIAMALLVASCGGDDASSTSGSTSGSPPETTAAPADPAADTAELTDPAEVDTATAPGDASDPEIGEITGIEDLAGAIGGEELTNAIDALGIDTRVKIIADQLGGTYEVTDESTAFLYLDGDATFDGVMVCFIVSAISSPGDVVVVSYPNGDVVCD